MKQDSLSECFPYLASNVDCHGVRELEGVEESVSDDCGPRVCAPHLHEL